MRKITDIYKTYNIMPNLQLHQLRVAAVAMQICNSSTNISLSKDDIITACLLHDMGNIIKFKLEYFPEFLEPQGLEYWQNIQQEFIQKYGDEEYSATIKLVSEIGVSDTVLHSLRNVLAHAAKDNAETFDLPSCVCKYADMRVSPKGILSLRERLEEWQQRDTRVSPEYMEKIYSIFSQVEKKIFSESTIRPENITNQSIESHIIYLKDFEI